MVLPSKYRDVYSAIVRSLENLPEFATFRIALRAHAPGSAYNAPSCFLRLAVRSEVRQVHVVIAVRQKSIAHRSEDARLVAAEVVGEDEIQSRSRLRLIVVVPVRVVPARGYSRLVLP